MFLMQSTISNMDSSIIKKIQKNKESSKISKEDFSTLKVLGKGSYAKVLLVKKNDTKE